MNTRWILVLLAVVALNLSSSTPCRGQAATDQTPALDAPPTENPADPNADVAAADAADGQAADEQPADEPPADEQPADDPIGDLLPDLDAGEDIELGPDGEPLADDQLGDDVDPITRIAEKMRKVEELLRAEQQKTDPRTAPLQEQIVAELNELLKQMKKQAQKQPSSGQSSNSPQQGTRSDVKQPSQRPKRNPGKDASNKPSRDSSERLGRANAKVDVAELSEFIKDIWGHLPEKDRERLRQMMSAEEVMPGHDVAIEKYFRRLAAEANE